MAPTARSTSRRGPRTTAPTATATHTSGAIPKLSGDIRPLIPTLGLRNYWYPAVEDRKVGSRKPVKVALLGEEICLFRGATGAVVALQDICPHRGARLSEGECHYKGTVACPYHGWVYDESGKNVAVLSEGPDSGVCGKPGTEAKVYPTRTLKGVIFVWIGEAALADPALIPGWISRNTDAGWKAVHGYHHVKGQWQLVIDNLLDLSHVTYTHKTTLAGPGVDDTPMEVEIDGEIVRTTRVIRNVDPAPIHRAIKGFTGKIDRWHRTLKGDCIRTETPLSLEDARRIVARYVEHYNTVRLHSAIGYVTPKDKLEGREALIFAERDRKLEQARERRKERRQAARQAAAPGHPANPSLN